MYSGLWFCSVPCGWCHGWYTVWVSHVHGGCLLVLLAELARVHLTTWLWPHEVLIHVWPCYCRRQRWSCRCSMTPKQICGVLVLSSTSAWQARLHSERRLRSNCDSFMRRTQIVNQGTVVCFWVLLLCYPYARIVLIVCTVYQWELQPSWTTFWPDCWKEMPKNAWTLVSWFTIEVYDWIKSVNLTDLSQVYHSVCTEEFFRHSYFSLPETPRSTFQ